MVETDAEDKRGVVAYVAIYLGWTWLFWGLVILSGQSVWTFPNVLFFYVGSVSPTLAGTLLIYRRSGVAGLRRLLNRIVNVRRITPRWLLVIVFLYPAITLVAAGITVVVGVETAPLNPTEFLGRLTAPLSLFALFGFTVGAGLVEETGSTGYFLDRLIDVWNPTVAGVVSGSVWASWHIPLFLMDGYFSEASFQPIVWRYFATFVFLETLFAWLYANTDRSVLAAILFHTAVNATGEILAPSQQVRWYVFGLTIAVALAVVGWQRRDAVGRRVRSVVG